MAQLRSLIARGLVVSNRDPLFSGRVKVWIPALHGAPPSTATLDADSGDDDSNPAPTGEATSNAGLVNLEDVSAGTGTGQAKWTNAEALPWAFVLGHNWGPIGNINTGAALYPSGRPNGVMCIPAVGTEVFITFEGESQDHPIVLGAVYHRDELLSMSNPTGLEISPGLQVTNSSSSQLTIGNYEDSVSDSYVIRSAKGSALIISDIAGNEQIILGGSIKATQSAGDFINGPNTQYHAYAEAYPNFPTTASAPRAKRQTLGKQTTTITVSNVASPSVNVQPPTAGTPPPVANKSYPMKAFNLPSARGVFHADRDGRRHNGIDLGTSGETGRVLIAPNNGQVLAYKDGNEKSSGGNYLIFKGVDGYCHRFMHLASIDPAIKRKIAMADYAAVAVGTVLGIVGGTGTRKDGKSYDIHLHWETIPLFSGSTSFAINITSRNALELFTEAQKSNGGIVPFTSTVVSTASFIDPIASWLTKDTGASLLLVNDQVTQAGGATDPNDVGNNKIIGLEVCMTPGKEHIYMRHPSGGYFGFDADGCFKLYSPGDAHIRVNRSVVADILGGVTTSCLAMFTRAKTLIRSAAWATPEHRNNGHQFDPSPSANKKETYDKFPAELLDIDTTRIADMTDAIREAGGSNLYITAASGGTKTQDDASKDGFNYVLSEREKQSKNFSSTTWNSELKTQFAAVFGAGNKEECVAVIRGSQYFKWESFRAMMLHESNGNKDKINSLAYGLFQLQKPAVMDVMGKVMVGKQEAVPLQYIFDVQNKKMTAYLEAKDNINMAMQYFNLCLRKIYATYVDLAVKNGSGRNFKKDITPREQDSLFMLAMFAYTAGFSKTSNLIRISVGETKATVISYRSVEDVMVRQNVIPEQLNYVPIILSWILPKLSS